MTKQKLPICKSSPIDVVEHRLKEILAFQLSYLDGALSVNKDSQTDSVLRDIHFNTTNMLSILVERKELDVNLKRNKK
jgi:hypothetical protein